MADTANVVKAVANFMGKNLSERGIENIRQRCSREYMPNDQRFLSKWDAETFSRAPKCSESHTGKPLWV